MVARRTIVLKSYIMVFGAMLLAQTCANIFVNVSEELQYLLLLTSNVVSIYFG